MRSIRRLRCGVTDKRLAWISFCVAHVHHSWRKWKGTIPPVVEQDAAEYGSEAMAYWQPRLLLKQTTADPTPRQRDLASRNQACLARAGNLKTTNLGVRSSNLFGRAIVFQ
jgi:hypothetical protein